MTKASDNTHIHMSRQTVLLIFFAALAGHLTEVLIVYACVLLHELAHLYVCKRLKIPTAYMAILPYGMELRLKKLTTPREQILISAAGPAVNLCLFAVGLCLMGCGLAHRHLSFFVSGNLVLFVFNLLPCTPLDGSEILRSAVSRRKGIVYSYTALHAISRITAFVILVCGWLLAIYGGNLTLLIIPPIIYRGMKSKKDEKILAVKKILNGEITSSIKPKVIYAKRNESAAGLIRYIGFDYSLIILRNQLPPLTQDRLIEALRKEPGIEVDRIV